MALRPQSSFCHGINDRESVIKRTLTKIKMNPRQGEGEIMVDAEEIQVKGLGWVCIVKNGIESSHQFVAVKSESPEMFSLNNDVVFSLGKES